MAFSVGCADLALNSKVCLVFFFCKLSSNTDHLFSCSQFELSDMVWIFSCRRECGQWFGFVFCFGLFFSNKQGFPFKKKAKWVKWRKGKRVLVIYVGYRCPADISSLPWINIFVLSLPNLSTGLLNEDLCINPCPHSRRVEGHLFIASADLCSHQPSPLI